ncbi:hypothetical protein [Shuttleworthella satelles]|nr:hypothetical protein [Shuttleworthia satelles]
MAQTIMERFAVGSTKARRLIRTESSYVFNEMNARADRKPALTDIGIWPP